MNTNLILIDEINPKLDEPEDSEEAQDGWVPNDAYVLAHTFRKRFGNELTPDLINDLLRDLNKIWRDREKKQIARLKTNYSQELATMKRKLQHRAPLDEVVSKKNIATLKKQVIQLHDELFRTNVKLQKEDKVPAGMDIIEQTLLLVA